MKLLRNPSFLLVSKWVIALGLVLYLVLSGAFSSEYWNVLSIGNLKYYFIGIALITANTFLQAFRMTKIIRIVNPAVAFKKVLRLSYVGFFLNNCLPGNYGGDVAKGYYFYREGITGKAESALAVILDRLVGLLSLSVVAVFFSFVELEAVLKSSYLLVSWIISVSVSLALILIFLLIKDTTKWKLISFSERHRLLKKWSDKLFNVISIFDGDRKLIAPFMAGVGAQLCFVVLFIILNTLFTAKIDCFKISMLTSLSMTLNAVPLTPGNVGWQEFVGSNLWRAEGLHFGAQLFIIFRILTIISSLPGLTCFLHRSQ